MNKTIGNLIKSSEEDELMEKVYHDKSKGVRDIALLLLRIWDIDGIDWNAAKKELNGFPKGKKFVKEMENLPLFKEIQKDYDKAIKDLSKEQKDKLFRRWESFERKEFGKLEDAFLEYMGSKYEKEGKTASRAINADKVKIAKELVKIAKELIT